MLTVWNKELRTRMNHTLAFMYKAFIKNGSKIKIKSTGIYRFFINGKLTGYGPARAAHGCARLDEYGLPEGEHVLVFEVYANNCNSFYLIDELPYFGAEISENGKTVADSRDFKAFYLNDRIEKVHRSSFQRCFVESYRMEKDRSAFYTGDESLFPEVKTEEVPGGKELERNINYPLLRLIKAPESFEDGCIAGYKNKNPLHSPRSISNLEIFSDTFKCFKSNELEDCLYDEYASMVFIKNGSDPAGFYKTYDMGRSMCGFFALECEAIEECDLYIVCDELISNTENGTYINMGRNDFVSGVKYHLKKGSYRLISFESYAGRYYRVIVTKGKAEIKNFGVISYENPDTEKFCLLTGDVELDSIIEAARNTFIHNAVDVLTDCPGRERAGWLCDSYFTGQAEKFFTGGNKTERNFLENIILSPEFKELPKGMLPMCYPADHSDGCHIPNWALWFIIELQGYYERSGERELIDMAERKVFGVLEYFKKFENEWGLLEDLTGWVFVEWSKCNTPDHIKGVNYPSNMLYMAALETAGRLYNKTEYIEKSEKLRENIIKYGFNGSFFTDNSLRVNGALVQSDNLTETCQYYAMFFGVLTKERFPELWDKMILQFGSERDENKVYPEVSKANAFIGNYLRLEALLKHGYKREVLKDCRGFFTEMAKTTGTLWEHMSNEASLDHGFASVQPYTYINVFMIKYSFSACCGIFAIIVNMIANFVNF